MKTTLTVAAVLSTLAFIGTSAPVDTSTIAQSSPDHKPVPPLDQDSASKSQLVYVQTCGSNGPPNWSPWHWSPIGDDDDCYFPVPPPTHWEKEENERKQRKQQKQQQQIYQLVDENAGGEDVDYVLVVMEPGL